ncbi:MAG: hypothetical protein ACKO21_06670 [Nodosilinea sp.]|jgi:hypothetical protein
MSSTINDINLQARHGSIAAIIQLLNNHFAESGIRTRAVQDHGVLQLLVEAPTANQLEQKTVVSEVQQVLESVSPRGISKVNINGRIVQEQQLLWLDDIKRDPKRNLLWFERVTLRQPNPLVRFWQDLNQPRQPQLFTQSPASSPANRMAFWRGLVGGASLVLFLLLVGWTTKNWMRYGLNFKFPSRGDSLSTTQSKSDEPLASPQQDPFVMAVRIAQQSVEDGRSSTTVDQWLELAMRWQRAADLMAQVPASDSRYAVAQDRIAVYSANKQRALEEAEKRKP